ncbi:hypothetical protein [Haliangium sp.]|uniref:hypothetical protein n=1 Tax=Haliangium sp. TaxID=2663208 RepID=UPI003D14BDE1
MRRDMAKKLVERPRHGGGRKRPGRRRPADESPRREPMSMGRGSKFFGENLAPLRRFLERRVGRPWDQVYREIRARLAPTSTVHMHVLQHLDHMVETRALMVDGVPHHPPGGRGGPRPIAGTRWDSLYVCPDSGRLQRVQRSRRRRRRDRADLGCQCDPRDSARSGSATASGTATTWTGRVFANRLVRSGRR